MFALCFSIGSARSGNGGINHFDVTKLAYSCLCNDNFITNRTMLALSFTISCTCCGNGGIYSFGMYIGFGNGSFLGFGTLITSSNKLSFFLARSLLYGTPTSKCMLTFHRNVGGIVFVVITFVVIAFVTIAFVTIAFATVVFDTFCILIVIISSLLIISVIGRRRIAAITCRKSKYAYKHQN